MTSPQLVKRNLLLRDAGLVDLEFLTDLASKLVLRVCVDIGPCVLNSLTHSGIQHYL